MRRVLVASGSAWTGWQTYGSILDFFESLSNRGYFVKMLLPSTRYSLTRREHLWIQTLPVKRTVAVGTEIQLYARILRIALSDVGVSTMVVDSRMLLVFILVRLLRRIKGVLLVWSRPVSVRGFLANIRSLQFRISLVLAKYFVDSVTAITAVMMIIHASFQARGFTTIQRRSMTSSFWKNR